MRGFASERKHRAPKGALRRTLVTTWHRNLFSSRKAPSAKRCIKTCGNPMYGYFSIPSQKAPSAKRCIKTWLQCECGRRRFSLRKHRAPNGALRRARALQLAGNTVIVRKHRAPKGALRLDNPARMHHGRAVRKHRAPKGALRRPAASPSQDSTPESESTERQKVH